MVMMTALHPASLADNGIPSVEPCGLVLEAQIILGTGDEVEHEGVRRPRCRRRGRDRVVGCHRDEKLEGFERDDGFI